MRVPVQMKLLSNKSLGILLAAGMTTAVYWPMFLRQHGRQYDYVVHFREAAKLAEGGVISGPHMLFHALTALCSKLFAMSIAASGIMVLIASVAVAAGLLYAGWTSGFAFPGWLKILLVPLLLIAAPIIVLAWGDDHLYFGYIGINVFHNPTVLVLKPFALAVFLLSSCFWRPASEERPVWLWWGLPLLLVLSALAKPSFLIVYLPGLTAFLMLRRLGGHAVEWRFFLLAVVAPSLLVLGWQYWVTYSASQMPGLYQGDSGIVFSPLTVLSDWSGWLLPKFFLSIAFPLGVTAMQWRSARRDPQLLLAWLIFAAGAVQMYCLMESGPRARQGNFVWGGQIGALLLFLAATAHYVKTSQGWRQDCRNPAWLIGAGLFVLHVLSGFVFYAGDYIAPQNYW